MRIAAPRLRSREASFASIVHDHSCHESPCEAAKERGSLVEKDHEGGFRQPRQALMPT